MVERIRRPTNMKAKPKPLPLDYLVPAEQARGYKLIMLAMPFFIISSYMLYKRVYLQEDKKVQLAEYREDGSVRWFTPEEIKKKDEESLTTRIFGTEDWLKNSRGSK